MSFTVEPGFPSHPQCHGSVCGKCGASRTGEPVVNTGIEVDLGQDGYYAHLYLCESCVTEWGRALGMVSADQASALGVEVAELIGRVAFLTEQLAAYSGLDDLLRTYAAEPRVVEPASKAVSKPASKATAK